MNDGNQPLVALSFDSKLLPPDQRFEAWRRALVSFDLSRGEATPFDAVAHAWMLGPVIVTHAAVDPLRYDRSRKRIAEDANDHFAMVYLLSGGFDGDYGRGTVQSRPGSLTIMDMRRPWWTDATRLDAFVVSITRAYLTRHLGPIDPHGLVTSKGPAALLGAMLEQMASKVGGLARHHAPMLSTIVRDLVARTIIDGQDDIPPDQTSRNDSLEQRVTTYIDGHLSDDLSARSICEAVGVSRSALYRAFGHAGGVQQEVQRRRVRRLRALLADSTETQSIARLVRSLGFADASHAARLFKKEYQRTPGEYRRASLAQRDSVPDKAEADAPRIFEYWTRLLE